MSAQHHGSEDYDKMRRFIEESIGAADRKWPDGRLSGDDDGETAVAIAADVRNKIVRIQFSKPMLWLGLDASAARAWAKMILEKADELDGAAKH